MKYFKLFEDWNGKLLHKDVNKFAAKLVNLSDGKLDGGSSGRSPGYRFKNTGDWEKKEMEDFLNKHYDSVIYLPSGQDKQTNSGSSRFPGWWITDRDTLETKKVLLTNAVAGAEKHEGPVIDQLNQYFESGDDSILSGQSKTIVDIMLAHKNIQDLDGFQCAGKGTDDTTSFAKQWNDITKALSEQALGNPPRFSQDTYNPADIMIWRFDKGEESYIIGASDIRSSDNALRKFVKEGKVWPISLKAGSSKWGEYNITKSAEVKYGNIKSINIISSGVSVEHKKGDGIRISNQGGGSVSYEVKVKESGGQGGKCPVAWWRDNMLNTLGTSLEQHFSTEYPNNDKEWINVIEKFCKDRDISFKGNANIKMKHAELLPSAFKLLLAYSKEEDQYSFCINLGTKAISAPLMVSAKNNLQRGSPFYKLG